MSKSGLVILVEWGKEKFYKRMSRDTMKYWRSSAPSSPRNVFTRCLRQSRIIFALGTRLCEVCCWSVCSPFFFFIIFFFYFKEPSVLLSRCLMRMNRLFATKGFVDLLFGPYWIILVVWLFAEDLVQSHREIFIIMI